MCDVKGLVGRLPDNDSDCFFKDLESVRHQVRGSPIAQNNNHVFCQGRCPPSHMIRVSRDRRTKYCRDHVTLENEI